MKKLRDDLGESFPRLQFDLKMKLSVFFLFATFFGLQANTGYAQKAKVTLELENVTVERLLDEIENKTEFLFVYKSNDVDLERLVSVKANKAKITSILNQVFGNSPTDYNIINKQIFLTQKDSTLVPKEEASISQDPIGVTGKVTDKEGISLVGATIQIKGTNRGVATDFDGNYTITVPNRESILLFTIVGFAPQEISVGNQTTINVTMQEAVSQLDEVVLNAGYYKTSQRKVTGNIAKVDAKDIEMQPISNPLQAIQGRMAGVFVQQTTGVPGGGFNIQIRGRNSLRDDGNNPLYLIDGVPFPVNPLNNRISTFVNAGSNPLASINPNDIESIEVLKDADATAIYGSRGANGVVLITTKKGRSGETQLDVKLSRGLGHAVDRMDLLNTEQYLAMRREGILNDGFDGFGESVLAPFFPDLYTWDQERQTDWQDELIGGAAEQTNANFTLSGGNSQTKYVFGGSYFKETTVFPGDNDFKRFSGRFNVNHTSLDKKLQVSLSANYSSISSDLPPIDFTEQALTLAPNAPALYDDEGNLNWENGTWENPLKNLESRYGDQTDNLVANADISYELFKGLRIKTNLNFNNLQFDGYLTTPISSLNPATITPATTGTSNFTDGGVKTWIVEPQLEYTRPISEGFLNVLIGSTIQSTTRESQTLSAFGFSSDAFLLNPDAAAEVDILGSNFTEYRYSALFARINYEWKNKYIINLTGRRDGSSRFGPGKQFGNFGAIGTAWIFSQENFIQKALPFLNFGKLRGSFGVTGSDQVPDYEFLETFSFTNEPYNGIGGLDVSRLANPLFSWESTKKLELGLELGLFNNRLFSSISWYRNRSTDQLVGRPLSNVTGDNSIQFNLPATVENRGWEFVVNTTNIQTKDFEWSTSFNLTLPENELLKFDNIEDFPAFAQGWEVGKPIWNGSGKRLKFIGVNPETGLYDFVDFNSDGVISPFTGDREHFVELGQQYYGGIQNSLRYKSFSLNFLFQFVKQKGLDTFAGFGPPGAEARNHPAVLVNRWQQPGDVSNFQQSSWFGAGTNNYFNYLGSDWIGRLKYTTHSG